MRERGEGKANVIIALLVTAVLVVLGLRVLPVYFKALDFKNAMIEQAKFQPVNRKTSDKIQDELFNKARDLDLPITREQIVVAATANGVKITTRFKVPVDLVVTTTNLSFSYEVDTSSAI